MDENQQADSLPWDDEAVRVFVKEVYGTLVVHKHSDPGRASKAAQCIRDYLDDLFADGNDRSAASNIGTCSAAMEGTQSPLNGVDAPDTHSSESEKDAIGRNYVSRLRELVVLDFLNAETRPIALHEVQALIALKGFKDSERKVIPQLHRMRQNNLIEKPNNEAGMYCISQAGRQHLAKLRKSHGAMLEQWLAEAAS